MQIVVLDGYAMNPGDLDWKPLEELGECAIYERTPAAQTVERSQDAEMVITNKVVFSREMIEQLPKLKYIGVSATGFNIVDVAAAREHEILVTNVPAYSTASVAQIVFAFILSFTHHVAEHSESANQKWPKSSDFAYWDFPLIELKDLTLGIIGFGRIGRAVAEIGKAFGMRIIFSGRRPVTDAPEWATLVELQDIFKQSDVLSLHCPLTEATRHIINADNLKLMKNTAYLINTGRGDLVDEQALADALNSETIAGAGVDVLSSEPPLPSNPLLSAKNCLITPHIGWATGAARQRLMDVVVQNVAAFLNGKPQNVVS